MALFALGCAQGGEVASTSSSVASLPATCSQTISGGASSGVELCKISGAIGHAKITGLKTNSGDHSSVSLALGFDSFPGSNPASIASNQMRIQWYGGGTPAPAAQANMYYGGTSGSNMGTISNTGYTAGAQSVCFDIVGGAQPQFIYWVTGVNSADCSDDSTLTLNRAVAVKFNWGTADASIAANKKNYYYASASIASTPTIELKTTPVSGCSSMVTSAAENANQALCSVSSTNGKHFRIENIDGTALGTATSKYFYLASGFEANRTTGFNGATTTDDGRFVLTGGKNHASANWTYLDFSGESTSGAPLTTVDYQASTTTLCADVAPPRTTLWAHNVSGADCNDRSTLTTGNAILHKTTGTNPWTSAAALASGTDYIRISGSTAPRIGVTRVLIFAGTAL
ncbi:MAG: hypothetical protein LDLANPLL_00231 [Turneriella sp.]|nr:hypothetical protein [Turneriella sp.]